MMMIWHMGFPVVALPPGRTARRPLGNWGDEGLHVVGYLGYVNGAIYAIIMPNLPQTPHIGA